MRQSHRDVSRRDVGQCWNNVSRALAQPTPSRTPVATKVPQTLNNWIATTDGCGQSSNRESIVARALDRLGQIDASEQSKVGVSRLFAFQGMSIYPDNPLLFVHFFDDESLGGDTEGPHPVIISRGSDIEFGIVADTNHLFHDNRRDLDPNTYVDRVIGDGQRVSLSDSRHPLAANPTGGQDDEIGFDGLSPIQ